MRKNPGFAVLAIFVSAFALSGCFGGGSKDVERSAGLVLSETEGATAVNRYLWVASLETLDFMPLEDADPYSGIILTNWYANPERPSERFKTTVYILDSRLRADALRVSVFRQVAANAGGWVDASVDVRTATEIENAILTRARELRLNSIDR
ncbi:MAG: DUF3576 domain-containing protein [Pseudomonadota bacterium]